MTEENTSQEFRRKNMDETRNCLIEEINQSEVISKKRKKVCATVNYIEHFLILGSTITGCVSISAFYSSRNYWFCNRIKNLCNNCRNQKL